MNLAIWDATESGDIMGAGVATFQLPHMRLKLDMDNAKEFNTLHRFIQAAIQHGRSQACAELAHAAAMAAIPKAHHGNDAVDAARYRWLMKNRVEMSREDSYGPSCPRLYFWADIWDNRPEILPQDRISAEIDAEILKEGKGNG